MGQLLRKLSTTGESVQRNFGKWSDCYLGSPGTPIGARRRESLRRSFTDHTSVQNSLTQFESALESRVIGITCTCHDLDSYQENIAYHVCIYHGLHGFLPKERESETQKLPCRVKKTSRIQHFFPETSKLRLVIAAMPACASHIEILHARDA